MIFLRFVGWLTVFLLLYACFFLLFQFGFSGFFDGGRAYLVAIQKLFGLAK